MRTLVPFSFKRLRRGGSSLRRFQTVLQVLLGAKFGPTLIISNLSQPVPHVVFSGAKVPSRRKYELAWDGCVDRPELALISDYKDIILI